MPTLQTARFSSEKRIRRQLNTMLNKSLPQINLYYLGLLCLPCKRWLCDSSSQSVGAFKLCGNDKARFPSQVERRFVQAGVDTVTVLSVALKLLNYTALAQRQEGMSTAHIVPYFHPTLTVLYLFCYSTTNDV